MLNWFERKVVGFIFVIVFSQQVMAQTGDWWQEEGGRIRISFDANPLGSPVGVAYGLIEVELRKGWKTYWKNPGSSGFGPELDIGYFNAQGQETKLTSELLFPAPHIFYEGQGNEQNIGYDNKLHLPFRLNLPSHRGRITGQVLIGLCDDICMPAQVDFAFDAGGRADFLTKGRIAAALSDLPQPADEDFAIRKIMKQDTDLIITVVASEGQFLDNKHPALFVSARNAQLKLVNVEKTDRYEFTYHMRILSGKLETGDRIDYTLIGSDAVSGIYVME